MMSLLHHFTSKVGEDKEKKNVPQPISYFYELGFADLCVLKIIKETDPG